jgi:Rod binding domain-containing protein
VDGPSAASGLPALAALDAAQSASVARAGAAARLDDREQAAKMFEELLATMLVREMRRGLEGGFFGGGAGSDIYEGWLDENVGRELSRSHALDLAQAIRLSLGSGGAPEEIR